MLSEPFQPETLGKAFLSSDHSSLVILTPDNVSPYLVRPAYNTVPPHDLPSLADDVHSIRGYSCLYNFQHHFWAVPGSRIYPPIPHPTLNISQDLEHDILQASRNPSYALLFRLPDQLDSQISIRALTALKWYNAAHRHNADEMAAIVHLAIAFEALLGLPPSEKTERLVDSIALLLGRIPRLDSWAQQFYDARSSIVHEGAASHLDFVPPRGGNKEGQQRLQSLLSYGTQIFRLCLGTLLIGADLAVRAGLKEKLTSNQERYESLCRILANEKTSPEARLEAASDTVLGLERFRFSSESGLRLDSLLGATRLAAKALLATSIPLEDRVRAALKNVSEAPRSQDHLPELQALSDLQDVVPGAVSETDARASTVYQLVKTVWSAVFMHYFWLKRQQTSGSGL